MTRQVRPQSSSWSRSAIPSARRWLALPVILAVLGAGAGVAAGATSKASAEALLLVRASTSSSGGVDNVAANAALQLNTSEIFSSAAEKTGGDAVDLQERSQIATVTSSQIVSITVTAPTTEQAVTEANAIADAGVSAGPDRMPQALAQLTEYTRDLLTSDNLANQSAERARVSRLGDELGANQAALVSDANQIQLLQGGEPSSRLPGPVVLGLMGALAGVLLGLAVALLLGVRRGTVKSARELTDLYPNAAVINSADLASTLALEPDARTIIVAGPRGAKLNEVTKTVRATLDEFTGLEVVLSDNLSAVPVGESPNGHVNLVTTTLSEAVLRRAIRDESSVLIVPVQTRVTKLEALEDFAPRLFERSYLVVDSRAPEWD